MKILLTNFVYNWGSTGYICRDLFSTLPKYGVNVIVAAGFDWGNPKSGVFTFCTKVERFIYELLNKMGLVSKFEGSPIATIRLLNYIKKNKPDIVHIHILNCNCCNMYRVLRWLGKNDVKTVITHHAEILYTANCNYSYDCNSWINEQCRKCNRVLWATGSKKGNTHALWEKMANAFSYFKTENVIFTAVSPWVERRSVESTYLSRFRCVTVMNGIDTGVFYKRKGGEENIVNTFKNGHTKYILYVSANFNPVDINDIKGGYYLVELAKMVPDINVLVVSTSYSNVDNLPSNVYLWGRAKSQNELAELYSYAELTVLTSKKETFSMICAESLCCGTPVVGFKAGGPETISLKKYSSFVDYPNIHCLAKEICSFRNKSFNKEEISNEACITYSRESMTKQYLNIYNNFFC